MQSFLTAAILMILKQLTSGDFMEHVITLVRNVANVEVTGDEKKRRVHDALLALQGDLGGIATDLSGYLLNLAIEGAVAYVKTHAA